jgi:hypothetical protein
MTFRNRVIITFLVLAAAAGCFSLFQPSPGKAAEKLLRRGREAIVTENRDRLAPVISLYYRDELGLSYAALRASFEYVFSQFSGIAIDYRVTGITIGKDTVIADLTVWARGTWMGATQDIAGTENDPVPLSILCKKEFLTWKVIGSRWPRGTAGLRELY